LWRIFTIGESERPVAPLLHYTGQFPREPSGGLALTNWRQDVAKIKDVPAQIWLQVGEDCDCEDFAALLEAHGTEVTWCRDKIESSDLGPFVYLPEVDRLTKECKLLKEEVEARTLLCTAYRLGDHNRADRALTKLETVLEKWSALKEARRG